MRIQIELKGGDIMEGTVVLKDESFIMIKKGKNRIQVIHWECIKDVKRIFKGEKQSINIGIFKRIRE